MAKKNAVLQKKVTSTSDKSATSKRPASKVSAAPEPRLRSSVHELSARKFELNSPVPSTTPTPAYEHLGELPDSYGTQRLSLICRDPQWAYAYWDWSWQQYQDAARKAHDGKVHLQLYTAAGDKIQQIQVYESTRNWYLHLNQPGETFYSELGIYDSKGRFQCLSRSANATAPRDTISNKLGGRSTTIPHNYSFHQLRQLIQDRIQPGEGLAEAMDRLQDEGFEFPFPTEKGAELSNEQTEAVLGYVADGDIIRRIQMGSFEITEILRRRFQEMQSSGQWMGSESVSSMSMTSPFGSSFGAAGAGRGRDFFMHVNAELIIYGGTHPDARVRVDGKEITLREDGTFSYHFALPDGQFYIPIDATSPDNVETRSAMLSFMRLSDYAGDVRKTGQPPLPEPLGRIS